MELLLIREQVTLPNAQVTLRMHQKNNKRLIINIMLCTFLLYSITWLNQYPSSLTSHCKSRTELSNTSLQLLPLHISFLLSLPKLNWLAILKNSLENWLAENYGCIWNFQVYLTSLVCLSVFLSSSGLRRSHLFCIVMHPLPSSSNIGSIKPTIN